MRIKPTLIVMLKEPRPGRVKTRLGRDIGMGAAAWWFRHQTARLLRRLDDPRWQRGSHTQGPETILPRLPQGGGDLGARMARVFRSLPPGPACIIGGDIPGVTPAHVARAFAALGGHDAAFGPAPDGGYWLIGLRHPGRAPAGFLTGVRWSTEHAMADSIATLPGHRIARVDTLADVDTAADLAPATPD